MYRNTSTTTQGSPFDERTIETVWQKGTPDPKYPSYRKDRCWAWMKRDMYGKTEKFGWEIDHERPVSLGRTDSLENLQPLFWENNRSKGDDYPGWSCKVRG